MPTRKVVKFVLTCQISNKPDYVRNNAKVAPLQLLTQDINDAKHFGSIAEAFNFLQSDLGMQSSRNLFDAVAVHVEEPLESFTPQTPWLI